MAALTAQSLVDAGTKPTFAPVAASDTAPIGNGKNTFAVYRNASGSSVNVTVVVPGNTAYGSANPDPVIAVAQTTGEAWIPLRKEYDDGSGTVTITTSAQTSVTVAIVKVDWA